ncbi:Glycosyl transferase [hydrothermal vent metagenome]|uniref:Glycosyl transferase n=1 Tax=hydrothermal vent metagenome TaxID=652676 RepID=A0A3B1BVX6_9ZZZZ
MQKITIVSAAYPLRGGIAHFAGLLYKELIKYFTVDVITFKRQYPSFLFPGKTQLEKGDAVEKIPTSVELDSINPLNWIKVGKKIRDAKPDLLILKYWMPFFAPAYGVISRIVKKNGKTKILAICHNVIPHEKKPGDRAFTKFFFTAVDYFILLSNSVKDDLLSIVKKPNYKVLFHPVYSNFGNSVSKTEAKRHIKTEEERVLLFFGFIRDYKGLDVLLKAVAILKSQMRLKLIIAGEFYSNEDKYLKLIDELDLKNWVTLHNDFIPQDEVKYYFSACDVVVLPYKSATQSGIVQIANNFNKPMISTNVGGLGEVIKENQTGYLVEKENPEQLANAILKYYNENKEEEFSNNIKSEREKYSWEVFVKEMLDLIETKKNVER